MVWYYLLMAIGLSAIILLGCCIAVDILLGCCIAVDYSTYRSLQKRLREERRRKLEEKVSAYT
jgi:hypothetical protein